MSMAEKVQIVKIAKKKSSRQISTKELLFLVPLVKVKFLTLPEEPALLLDEQI